MKPLPIVLVFLLALSVFACSKETPQPVPLDQPTTAPPQAQTTNTAAQAEPSAKVDPSVASLFSKIGSVKSYTFELAYLPDGRAPYKFLIKGNKAKVELHEPLAFQDGGADVVYLDFDAKSAYAYCTKLGTNCADLKQARKVNFEDYNVVLPPQWVDKLTYGAKKGSLTFNDAQVTVVQYSADGKWFEGYVHPFYGMPLRVAIATDKEMTTVVGGYEYRSMSFNTVKDSDVTAPQ